RASVELHADALFLAPDHPAGQLRSIGLEEQGEIFRDADRARDLEGGAGFGEIADRAVDRAAAELDRSALQHAMSGSVPPILIHAANLQPKLNQRLRPRPDRGYFWRWCGGTVSRCGVRRFSRLMSPAETNPSVPAARRRGSADRRCRRSARRG